MENRRKNVLALRQQMTAAESHLWQALRNRSLGVRFRRQYPLGRHIVDFVCLERRLVIEVDGGQHLDNPEDAQRDAWLRQQDYRILRFWNNDVLPNRDGVLEVIQDTLRSRCLGRSPSPSPSRRGEGNRW